MNYYQISSFVSIYFYFLCNINNKNNLTFFLHEKGKHFDIKIFVIKEILLLSIFSKIIKYSKH